jgi:hypothetical protein
MMKSPVSSAAAAPSGTVLMCFFLSMLFLHDGGSALIVQLCSQREQGIGWKREDWRGRNVAE